MEIKLLIFDFDGCLVDTSDIHLNALNKAISDFDPSYCISKEQDNLHYGTITSKDKLKKLTELTGFPQSQHEKTLELKKKYTLETIDCINIDTYFKQETLNVIKKLSEKYTLCIGSNTNKEFIDKLLKKTKLKKYFKKVYCSANIINSKPHSEVYIKCISDFRVNPEECIIFEDSITGQEAAIKSGAHLYPLESPDDVDYEKINSYICNLKPKSVKFKSNKINIVIPAAGMGQRFVDKGYKTAKPFINVNKKPMIAHVVEKLNIDANFIFIIKQEHLEQYQAEQLLNLAAPNCKIVTVNAKQQGAATTILEARHLIDNDDHLLIVNSDQIWDWDANTFYYKMIKENLDGGIAVFDEPGMSNKWSYAKVDGYGFVTEVAEKTPISTLATAGTYWWKHGSDFVKYADQMVTKNIRVNNEFYTSLVYNELIQDNKKVKTYHINKFIGLGTPEELEEYLVNNKE